MSTLDVEDESILSAIFKDSFPETWRENPDFALYLSELSSYGINQLSREPERLAEERSQVLEQTQDLAFHNYKTFIQTAECSKEIFQDYQIIEQHVGGMLERLPNLVFACNEFISKAQEINTSRRMNNLTLQKHTQLLEILEIPQLMDTCVRNGYYEEALELAAHVKRMEKKHANIPVIMTIVTEVKGSLQLMLNQLVHQLRTNVQLPACLRVIGFLRRMDVFTEAELRIKFLQARDVWFQGLLRGIPSDDPYYHITKTIEASRVHLFDIITQYRAIFSDEDPLISTAKDESINESALFHGWVVQKLSQFLKTLKEDLDAGVGSRLDSVLGQCMYFGLSFSRVGADFRGLLAPIFQQAALRGFSESIIAANNKFDEAMQSYTLLGTPSVLPSSAFSLATQGSGSLQPPVSLLEYHPMAAYCNDLLTTLNDLRLCSPLSLACDVAGKIQNSLAKAAEALLAYHRAEETTFNQQEAERFGWMCAAFCDDLVPHFNKCLQALFPPAQLAQILGLSIVDLCRMGQIGQVDVKAVTEPIIHLVPDKKEPPATETSDSKSEPDPATAPIEQTEGLPVTFNLGDDDDASEEDNAPEEVIDLKKKLDKLEGEGEEEPLPVLQAPETVATEENPADNVTPSAVLDSEKAETKTETENDDKGDGDGESDLL